MRRESNSERIREPKSIKKGRRRLCYILVLLAICWFFPTWTPKLEGDSSISEYRKITINGTELQCMIRGKNKDNPVILFVHGGPGCSEIPYVRKYQKELEEFFTVVHYDQRGSGKSFQWTDWNESLSAEIHKNDLIQLTEYLQHYLGQSQVILVAHSYGTYFATMAAAERPDLYRAYVGIGQMADTVRSELDSLDRCIYEAQAAGNDKDIEQLEAMRTAIASGEPIVPRKCLHQYGMAARKINDNRDYWMGFLFNREYNLSDVAGFYMGCMRYQDALIREATQNPLTQRVTEMNLPVYFIMGQYDGMTSPYIANEFLNLRRNHIL